MPLSYSVTCRPLCGIVMLTIAQPGYSYVKWVVRRLRVGIGVKVVVK